MNIVIIISIVSLIVAYTVPRITRYYIKNYKQPKYSTKLQKPGQSSIFITKVPTALLIVTGFGALMGFLTRDTEMTIVFGVLLLIISFIFFFIQRKYNMSYQEKEEYFISRVKKDEYKVYYDDIIDWQLSVHGIEVLDGTRPEQGYVNVIIGLFKPEMLLRRVAEMTFDGKFIQTDDRKNEDPQKKTDMVNFLTIAGYDYLIRDYLEDGEYINE